MEILWLAIVFYSIGLAVILHFRPALMFNENGSWKEFGYQRTGGDKSRHTLFPFWLFAIVWAFVSYVIAASIVHMNGSGAGSATAALATASSASYFSPSSASEYDDDEYEEEEDEDVAIPVSKVRKSRTNRSSKNVGVKTRPGYYVLDPNSKESGLRKYIYYGPERPTSE
jgi:uncharacterized membrane protein YcgQ (UPF0703/DUF1980 family)